MEIRLKDCIARDRNALREALQAEGMLRWLLKIRNDHVGHVARAAIEIDQRRRTIEFALSDVNDLFHWVHSCMETYSHCLFGRRFPKDRTCADDYANRIRRQRREEGKENRHVVFDSLERLIDWLRARAIEGSQQIQNDLGSFYSDGEFVPADRVQGLAWFIVAEEGGDRYPALNRARVENLLSSDEQQEAKERARGIQAEIRRNTPGR